MLYIILLVYSHIHLLQYSLFQQFHSGPVVDGAGAVDRGGPLYPRHRPRLLLHPQPVCQPVPGGQSLPAAQAALHL